MKFHELLKDFRKDKKLSQKQIAEVIYTSPQNVAHYEHNRRSCDIQQAIEILDRLGIDVLIKNGEMERDFRMCKEYVDKNGKEIKEGMILRHEDGDVDLVLKADSNELGFNATNFDYAFRTGLSIQLYPLSSFDLREWEIVAKEDLSKEENYHIEILMEKVKNYC